MSYLEDRMQIEDLHRLYGHAVDRYDFKLLRSLYTDDAMEEHGLYNGPVDGYIDWAKEIMAEFEMTVHLYFCQLVWIEGDQAESETRTQHYVRRKGNAAFTSGNGRYLDKYERTAKGWLFKRRTLCSDLNTGLGLPQTGDLSKFQRGAIDGTDPFYSRVPNLAKMLRARYES